MKMVPHLVAAGIDVLDNIQPSAGMDPYAVKREFGDRIVVQAQVDQHAVLPKWRPEEIYRKYRRMIEDLAPGGGFIISPTFRSQNTPPENLLAVLKAIGEPL
jgi:uroporphyrinogen decarboxylase